MKTFEEITNTEEFKKFDAYVRVYLENVKTKAEEGLSPEELDVFRIWWKGGNVDWDTVPKKAHNAILWACGQGAG